MRGRAIGDEEGEDLPAAAKERSVTTGSIGKDRNSIICTACGAANPPGSRFCERCGTRLPQQAVGNQPTRITPTPTPPIPPATGSTPRFAAPEAPAASSVPDPTPARDEAAQASPSREETPTPPASSDSPMVTVELAPTREITRDAPTEIFELSHESRPASDRPAPTPTPPSDSLPADDQPTQVGSGWGYRSWTPPTSQAPPTAPGNAPPPAEVIQVVRPASDAGGAPQERVSAPETSPFVAPTTAPLTYPSGGTASNAAHERVGQPYGSGGASSGGTPGMGQPDGASGSSAPPPTGYMANAGRYPAPANGSNNRTLWIILGVVGGLVLLCIIICLLIVVVAAVSSANTAGVATSVATATRR